VPISYAGRDYSEGKKINWKDGVAAFFHILRFNVFPPRRRAVIPTAASAAIPTVSLPEADRAGQASR